MPTSPWQPSGNKPGNGYPVGCLCPLGNIDDIGEVGGVARQGRHQRDARLRGAGEPLPLLLPGHVLLLVFVLELCDLQLPCPLLCGHLLLQRVMLLMQCVDSVLMLLRSMVTVALVLGYFLRPAADSTVVTGRH